MFITVFKCICLCFLWNWFLNIFSPHPPSWATHTLLIHWKGIPDIVAEKFGVDGSLFPVVTKCSHGILWQFVNAVKYRAFYLLMWKSFANVWCYRWCSVWLPLVACRSSALRCPPGSPPCSTLWRSETPSSPFSSATRTLNLSVQEPRALCGQYLFITLLCVWNNQIHQCWHAWNNVSLLVKSRDLII